jgi:hypothetical protein
LRAARFADYYCRHYSRLAAPPLLSPQPPISPTYAGRQPIDVSRQLMPPLRFSLSHYHFGHFFDSRHDFRLADIFVIFSADTFSPLLSYCQPDASSLRRCAFRYAIDDMSFMLLLSPHCLFSSPDADSFFIFSPYFRLSLHTPMNSHFSRLR